MSICTKTLYDVFPAIKAFGCCHEVFHAQNFLCCVLKEIKGIKVGRNEIYTDASGINHFTWITEARYGDIDILSLLPEFADRFFEEGYYEKENDRFGFLSDPFAYGNKVKMDLFKKHGALAAAGDRHLAEFLNANWYLKDPETVKSWAFNLTGVDWRERDQREKIAESELMAAGKKPFPVVKSDEIAVDIMKALLGFSTIITNVNMPNRGQAPQLPEGSVVETNCVFSNGQIKPVTSNPLPLSAASLVNLNCANIDCLYEGIKERNLNKIFTAFINQPLLSSLTFDKSSELFEKMCMNTREYLDPYFDLDGYFKAR